MRLLQLGDKGECSLVEFVGNDIPRYAILSHTWGSDSDEVTFHDLIKGRGKDKLGYRKVRFCIDRAARDGLRYSWVDTCCIDKSNSAELQEAINSMFRWFQNAAKCYVYLPDVSIGGFATNDQSFQKSRWFTRGWTLQELLAPTSVEFFSAEGERLGCKDSLVQEIAKITGISVQALQGRVLSQFSIDERMSWAERRETKREEDAAYSLLGIFDVHMPLLYGEGRRNAFARLQRELKDSSKNRPSTLRPAPFLQRENESKYQLDLAGWTCAEEAAFEGHNGWVNAVAFSPDGKQLASASSDQTVRLWDTVVGGQIQQLEGHNEYVSAVAFSPDGTQLASASGDWTVKLWDAATGEQVQWLRGHSEYVNAVAFSPNGKQLASASSDRTVRLWDTMTGKQIRRFDGHSATVRSVAFSPDGKQLASASSDLTVRLWDLVIGEEVQQLGGHSDRVNAIAFSADGKQLASASSDCTVSLWDAVAGEQVQWLRGHSEYVNAVAFSPNGEQLASASNDQIVRLWDTATGKQIRRFDGHSATVRSVAFSPDGKKLASASGDWTVRLWCVATG